MSSFARARALFERIVDLPTSEQLPRLSELCGADQALFDLVKDMLGNDGEDFGLDTARGMSVPVVLAAELLDFEVPDRLGRFRVLRELGRGGMGIVYEGEQDVPRRKVALKTLPALAAELDSAADGFRREVDAMARVTHPGIPRVYEVFVADGRPVVSMELVHGDDIVQGLQGRPRADRLRVLERLCEALHAAHGVGVVHRDLKPSNVLLDEHDQPRVLDFGIASLVGEAEAGAGTLAYAAPEQIIGAPPDPRMDVYGLGALACEVLLGSLPHDDASSARSALKARRPGPGARLLPLPTSLRAVLAKALAPDPDDRYSTARALGEDLARARRGMPVRALAHKPVYVAATLARRGLRLAPLVLLGALIAAILAGGGLWLWRLSSQHARVVRAAERLERLQAEQDELTERELQTAFTAFVGDRDHDATPALAQAHLWRAAQLEGQARRRMLLSAWTTAVHRKDADAALILLADVLAQESRWDALHHVLQRLPAGAAPEARLRMALATGDLSTARRWLPPEHAGLLGALAEARSLMAAEERPLDVHLDDRIVTWADPRGVFEVSVDTGEAVLREVARVERLARDPKGDVWVALAPDRSSGSGARGERVHLQARLSADGEPELVGGVPGAVHALAVADADRDGTLERYFGTGPYSRTLQVAEPPHAPSRVLHAGTERLGSDIGALLIDDLDGDGTDEAIVGTFGWERYDLRVLDDPPEPRLAGRARMGVREAAVRRTDSGIEIVAYGPVAGSRPLAVERQHLARFRWTGEALELIGSRDVGRVERVVVADADGDGRQDILLSRTDQTDVLLDDGQGGLRAFVLPRVVVVAAGQLDEDPASELIAVFDSGIWLLGAGGGALPLPAHPTDPGVPPVPAGLSTWLAQRWSRAGRMSALGLRTDAAATLAPLQGRADRIGRLANLQVLEWLPADQVEEAAKAARALVPELEHLDAAERARVARVLQRTGQVDELVQMGVIEAPTPRVVVSDDRVSDALIVHRPAEARRRPGAGLSLRAIGQEAPVMTAAVVREVGPLELAVRLDVHAMDWGSSVRFSLARQGSAEPDLAVTIGRGGGGEPDTHFLTVTCQGADQRRTRHSRAFVAQRVEVRLRVVDGLASCTMGDGTIYALGRVVQDPQPSVLAVHTRGGEEGVAVVDASLSGLALTGLSLVANERQAAEVDIVQSALIAGARGESLPAASSLEPRELASLVRLQPHRWLPRVVAELPPAQVAEVWHDAFYWPASYRMQEGLHASLAPALDAVDLTALPLQQGAAHTLVRTRIDAWIRAGELQAPSVWLDRLEEAGDHDFVGLRRARLALRQHGAEAATEALGRWLERTGDVEGSIDRIADDPELRPLLPRGVTLAPIIR